MILNLCLHILSLSWIRLRFSFIWLWLFRIFYIWIWTSNNINKAVYIDLRLLGYWFFSYLSLIFFERYYQILFGIASWSWALNLSQISIHWYSVSPIRNYRIKIQHHVCGMIINCLGIWCCICLSISILIFNSLFCYFWLLLWSQFLDSISWLIHEWVSWIVIGMICMSRTSRFSNNFFL